MAKSTTEWFDDITKSRMQKFFGTLSEKDKRRFAAWEAQRLGHGGMTSPADVLGCSTKTMSRGVKELDQRDEDPAAGRVRRPGGGRQKTSRRTLPSNRT